MELGGSEFPIILKGNSILIYILYKLEKLLDN